jgi:Tol biopolymer transport system component
MKNRKLRRNVLLLIVTAAASGCRDGVPPFTPADREIPDDAWALTFGYGQDADPQWLPTGDSLLYHTDRLGTPSAGLGVLARIDARGGIAAVQFAAIHASGRMLATPVYSPAGDRVAYTDVMRVHAPEACGRSDEMAPTCFDSQPLLDSAALRVRAHDALGPIFTDVSLGIKFAGTSPARTSGGPLYIERLFPFQAAHRDGGALLFRPSWSPTGESLAFSDGLSLYTWNVGNAAASPIPGTADGVSAAWSPDGDWIAFTLLQRADSQTFNCMCGTPQMPITAVRTIYDVGERSVVLIRPDGSDRVVIGPGEDPAWSPDGQHLYVRRSDQIVRITRTGSDPIVVPNTTRGRSPAVSPDGRLLAFSRRKPQQIVDWDIWVVRLQP